MANQFVEINTGPTPSSAKSPQRWLGAALGLFMALAVVGLTLFSLSAASRADETLAPTTGVTISSPEDEGSQLSPGQQVVYTITVENTSFSDDAVSGTLTSTLSSQMQILSVDPATATQSSGSGIITLTWDVGPIPARDELDFVLLTQLADDQIVLHDPLPLFAKAILFDDEGGSDEGDDTFTHYVLNADNLILAESAIASGGFPVYNDIDEVVAGEAVTVTVVSTIPMGTMAYTYTPRVLLEDGLWPTGSLPTNTLIISDQQLIDPAHLQNRLFTQLEFDPLTITDTDAAPQVITYVIYAQARQHYFLGAQAGQEIEEGKDLYIHPIARWCEGPGCTVMTDTAYVKLDETNSLELIRPDVYLDNPDQVYLDAERIGQGNGQVKFELPIENRFGSPTAYDIVLTATLGPGLSFSGASDGSGTSWSIGSLTYITWTVPDSLPSNEDWTAYLTATLPPTFVVGSQFTHTVDIHQETFLGDVPYEGAYVNRLTDDPDYPDGYVILPGVGHVKATRFSVEDVKVGDQFKYVITTTVGAGTALYSPFYSDTLPVGFHLTGTVDVQGVGLTGYYTAPGATQGDWVKQELIWSIEDLDNLTSSVPVEIVTTYTAENTGIDYNEQPVYISDSDIRSARTAENSAILFWTPPPGVPASQFPTPAEVRLYFVQPFMARDFATSRTDSGPREIGQTADFQISFKNSGRAPAYDLQVCDRLPQGLTYGQLDSYNPDPDCTSQIVTQTQSYQGDRWTVCWIIDQVCADNEDYTLNYQAEIQPYALPGLPRTNHAYISDYSSQPGGANDGDGDDDDLPNGVRLERHYSNYPEALSEAQCDDVSCLEILGLAGLKSSSQPEVAPGQTFTYSLAFTDTSDTYDYTGLVITDVYDANLIYVSADPPPMTHTVLSRTLYWQRPFSPTNQNGRQEIILTMQITQAVSGKISHVTNTLIWDWNENPTAPLELPVMTPLNTAGLHIRLTGPDSAQAGGPFTYTLVYSNDGSSEVDATLTIDYGPHLMYVDSEPLDPVGADNVFVDPNLANTGENYTQTIYLTVTEPLPYDLAQIYGQVEISSPGSFPAFDETYTPLRRPVFDFVKDGPDIAPMPGAGTMLYQFTLVNTGDLTATHCIITDTWDPNTSFVQGVNWTVSGDNTYATYSIAQIDANGGSVDVPGLSVGVDAENQVYTNTAVLHCAESAGQQTVQKSWAPSVETYKTVTPDPAFPGRVITYTINYTNTGGVPMTGLVITDYLPAGVSYGGCDSPDPDENCQFGWGCGQVGSNVVWQCDSLRAGRSGYLILTGTVTAEESTYLTNQTASDADTAPLRTGNVLRTLVARPKLSIVKSDHDIGPVAPGDLVTYTLTYTNDGSYQAEEVVVTDYLPEQATFVSCTPTCTQESGVVTWQFTELPVNASQRVSTTIQVNAGTDGQILANDYDIRSTRLYDPIAGPTLQTQILDPHLTLFKEAYPDAINTQLTPITYTISYYNDGGGTLTGVVITDELSTDPPVAFSSASPGCSHSGESAGGVVTCVISDLIRAASGQLEIHVENVTAQGDTTIVNQAEGNTNQTDSSFSNEAYVWIDTDGCYEIRIADFVSNSPVAFGQSMHFTATYKPVVADPPISYQWDFGDNNTDDAANPNHQYGGAGTYTVTLTLDNACPQEPVSVTHVVEVTTTADYTVYMPIVIKGD